MSEIRKRIIEVGEELIALSHRLAERESKKKSFDDLTECTWAIGVTNNQDRELVRKSFYSQPYRDLHFVALVSTGEVRVGDRSGAEQFYSHFLEIEDQSSIPAALAGFFK